MRSLFAAAVLVAGALAQSAIAASVLEISPALPSNFSGWGECATCARVFGQTFTQPALDTKLESFAFRLDDNWSAEAPELVRFHAYLYAWDGTQPVGSALFASEAMSTTNNGGVGGYETITVQTGGLDLLGGQQYVAYFDTSAFVDGANSSSALWLFSRNDIYAGGAFVHGSSWRQGFIDPGADVYFRAEFSSTAAIPEPESYALLLAGLSGLGFAARRRALAKADSP